MKKYLVFTFVLILLISSINALDSSNFSRFDAESAISQSTKVIQELNESGFGTTRANDILTTAKNIYDSQILMEKAKKTTDYSLVLSYTKQISDLQEIAYQAKDIIFSLDEEYSTLKEKALENRVDISETSSLMNGLLDDYTHERYEEVIEKSDAVEKSILDADAEITTLNVFYSSLSRGITAFVKNNWIGLLVVLVLLILFIPFYKLVLYKYVLLKKLKKLKAEQDVLKSLIQKSQKDYFEKGKMSEATYHTRIDKYSEMIRDLERQIPLIKEELAKQGSEEINQRLGLNKTK